MLSHRRGWFFPLSIRVAPGKKASFSMSVVAFGVLFTTLHGYLNAKWFAEFAPNLSDLSWFSSPWFLIGYPMYEISFWLTIHSKSPFKIITTPYNDSGISNIFP